MHTLEMLSKLFLDPVKLQVWVTRRTVHPVCIDPRLLLVERTAILLPLGDVRVGAVHVIKLLERGIIRDEWEVTSHHVRVGRVEMLRRHLHFF
jgi:hypothetical protein